MDASLKKQFILQACSMQNKIMMDIVTSQKRKSENNRKRIKARFLRNMNRKLHQNFQLHMESLNEITTKFLKEIPLQIERRLGSKRRSRHWWNKIFNNDKYDEMIENFRMDKKTFMFLCDKLRPELTPKPSNFKAAISVELKVAVSLYKLASCAEYRVVGNQFGLHKSTVHRTLFQFCRAVLKVFLREEINLPDDEEIFKLMDAFELKSNIPNIWGTIDGTHIPVTPEADGYRDFINRKGWPSLVLQAVVDNNYLFRDITCKHPGSTHDATVFKDSGFYGIMNTRQIPVKVVDGTELPACILGDPAYPLLPWLLKGYTGSMTPEQESFNIYLNKARVVVENAFGRLKGRWRILQKKIDINVKFVPNVVAVCCILHNILEKQRVPYLAAWNQPIDENVLEQPESSSTFSNTIPGDELREFLKNYLAKNVPLLKSHIRNN